MYLFRTALQSSLITEPGTSVVFCIFFHCFLRKIREKSRIRLSIFTGISAKFEKFFGRIPNITIMKKIQMVDLYGQYEKIKPEIDSEIQRVIESTAFINGPAVREFQEALQSWLGVHHVIPCGNGTDALQIALMVLGLKPGDEVIAPDFTFVATAEVVALLGLKPVFVDVDPDTFTMSPEAFESAITPRTRAVIPVHLFGQCCNMHSILSVARKYNLFVIEDVAQATGAEYTFPDGRKAKAGTMGDIGCTSFFPSKNLGCYGDGGAMMTNDDSLAEKLRSIANHGMKVRYYHDRVGVNSRLDTLQAAILKVKLKYLDAYNAARQKAAAFYDSALNSLPSLSIPARAPWSNHIFHQYTLKVTDSKRDKLKEHLERKGIPSMIYYPVPLHLQKAYSWLGYRQGQFPVTEELCSVVLSLPMHTELDEGQLRYICSSIKEFMQ